MDNKRSLFTVRLFNTYEPVTSFYQDLIPYWVEQGWQVEVIISKALYRSGRERSLWLSSGVHIYETPNFGLQANGRFSKFIIMLSYIVFAIGHTLTSRTVDRNLFLTQPPLFFAWGLVLKVIRRQPYFIVLMDLYPDVAIRAHLLATNNLLITRILKFISRQGLRRANGIVAIGRCMVHRLREIGIDKHRIHFIPNWVNETVVKPIPLEQNSFRQAERWQGKFVVMYSGNIGTSHYFDDILGAILQLRDRSDIVFVFIGDGHRKHEIESFREQHQLENMDLLPFQNQARLAESLSAGDLHFVSLRLGFEGLVVPSKSYGIMAAGRPILYQGAEGGEIPRMIHDEGIGEVIPIGKVDRLVTVILNYASDRNRLCSDGKRARQLIETEYSTVQACQRYTQVLSKGK